jgi:hypothetical protein
MTARLFFSATAALTLATSLGNALFAYSSRNTTSCDAPVNCESPWINLPPDGLAPYAGPRAKDPGTLELSVAFTYWTVKFDHAAFAAAGFLGVDPVISFGSNVPEGKVSALHWSFQPGYKVKAGWIFPSNHWELFAEYTWRHQPVTTAHAKASGRNPNLLSLQEVTEPFTDTDYGDGTDFPNCHSMSGSWSQHFNVLDFMLATNFYVTRTVSLQPMLGLKAYNIHTPVKINLYHVRYVTESITAPYEDSTIKARQVQSAKGLGPRIGAYLLWNFNRNWGLYSKLAFAAPWTYYQVHYLEKTQTAAGVSAPTHNVGKKDHEWQGVVEYELGFSFQAWFNREKCEFSLRAGWESQTWNFQRFLRGNGTLTAISTKRIPFLEHMALNGLTLNASVAF